MHHRSGICVERQVNRRVFLNFSIDFHSLLPAVHSRWRPPWIGTALCHRTGSWTRSQGAVSTGPAVSTGHGVFGWRLMGGESLLEICFSLGKHLSVHVLKWFVSLGSCTENLRKTKCYGFLTVWRVLWLNLLLQKSESKGSKGHENMESFETSKQITSCSMSNPRHVWK